MRSTYMIQAKAAKAIGNSLPISPKVAVEICSFLRGRDLDKAIAILERVERKEQAIPYKRFNADVGHKPGPIAAGRYPVKAAGEFLKLLKNAKANAANQGMSGTLRIIHIAANRASEPHRNRSKFRQSAKRTHVEIMLGEGKKETPKTAPKTAPKGSSKATKKEAPAVAQAVQQAEPEKKD